MVTNIESVLLDTSVWIDALQGRTPHIVKMTQELLNEDRILTCGPVIFEIKRGLRPPERKKILPLFDALIRLSVDETTWDAGGDLDASLRKKGITIPPMDVIIAQVCLHHKVFLFTLDEHFRSVPRLKIFEFA
ncbi:MAG: PIN domain-containing protein [Deltaproteobacteria bacterium]|nr:PIN domain-containing protein [Deltaproteobacteria bacterium]MBW2680538.1 PIN domain-containing protein [Deltaproteobacteria bacterium]